VTAASRVLTRVRPGAAVRGAGVAVACLSPTLRARAGAIAASYAVGWPLGRPGLQFIVIVPDEDEAAWKRTVLPVVTSAVSWTALMLGVSTAVRRLPVPIPVAAALLGAGVAAADSLLRDMGERLSEKATAAAEAADAEEPAPS
jgi:hypothetical protein